MQCSTSSAGMNYPDLTQTLVDSFNALAEEVQNLNDRRTILEHKLRFAHEQFQYLADKYAPAAPKIEETLAKLQIPPELHHPALEHINFVPLPHPNHSDVHHKIALLVREGRKVAQQLTAATPSHDTGSSRVATSRNTLTSVTTAMEQDFTVEGKRGNLGCPFQTPNLAPVVPPSQSAPERPQEGQPTSEPKPEPKPGHIQGGDCNDATPHHSADPICAAIYEETMSSPLPASGSSCAAAAAAARQKCPIRYLDQHSPEEIANYVEKHKHEIPRSHEVCVRRYQRNEDQIRKLDAKYGNLVAMIQDLSQLHKPMLPLPGTAGADGHTEGHGEGVPEVERASNEMVENWAHDVAVGPSPVDDPDSTERPNSIHGSGDDSHARESHFDRPMKEVRVGESPSRPWGISVPAYSQASSELGRRGDTQRIPFSPPPAPVVMPSSSSPRPMDGAGASMGKCPFGHGQMLQVDGRLDGHMEDVLGMGATDFVPEHRRQPVQRDEEHQHPTTQPFDPFGPRTVSTQPAFISPPPIPGNGRAAAGTASEMGGVKSASPPPQMLFTGPVFIGYPIEQAAQFMEQFNGMRGR